MNQKQTVEQTDKELNDEYLKADWGRFLDSIGMIPIHTESQARRVALRAAEKIAKLESLLETAWGVVANASMGDWSKESPHWVEAAGKWRDDYFAELGKGIQLAKNLEYAHALDVVINFHEGAIEPVTSPPHFVSSEVTHFVSVEAPPLVNETPLCESERSTKLHEAEKRLAWVRDHQCSCHINSPCQFCTSLSEVEADVYCTLGYEGLIRRLTIIVDDLLPF